MTGASILAKKLATEASQQIAADGIFDFRSVRKLSYSLYPIDTVCDVAAVVSSL